MEENIKTVDVDSGTWVCPSCGKNDNSGENLYCGSCGTKRIIQQPAVVLQSGTEAVVKQKKLTVGKKILIFVPIVFILFVLIVYGPVVWNYFYGFRFARDYDFYSDGRRVYKGYCITEYVGKDSDTITIPSKIGFFKMESIGALNKIYSKLFSKCTKLETVYIEDGITVIGSEAFINCTRLESVYIPDSVIKIGQCAFMNCTSLKNVVIPNSVTDIGVGMNSRGSTFYNCTSLENITLPSQIKKIYSSTFEGCTNLKYITLPESVEAIDEKAFLNCTSLESIVIPSTVNEIHKEAFSGTAIETIALPPNLQYISAGLFAGCKSLNSIVIPDKVHTIAVSAFSACTSLTDITWGSGVKTIEGGAFAECGFENLYIPDTVTEIKSLALSFCPKLKTVQLPSNLTYLGYTVFRNCEALEYVVCNNVRFNKMQLTDPIGDHTDVDHALYSEIGQEPPSYLRVTPDVASSYN